MTVEGRWVRGAMANKAARGSHVARTWMWVGCGIRLCARWGNRSEKLDLAARCSPCLGTFTEPRPRPVAQF